VTACFQNSVSLYFSIVPRLAYQPVFSFGIQTVGLITVAPRPDFNSTYAAVHFQRADAAIAGLIVIVPVAIIILLSQFYLISGAFIG
jgi:hypothetical protein